MRGSSKKGEWAGGTTHDQPKQYCIEPSVSRPPSIPAKEGPPDALLGGCAHCEEERKAAKEDRGLALSQYDAESRNEKWESVCHFLSLCLSTRKAVKKRAEKKEIVPNAIKSSSEELCSRFDLS